MLMRSNPAAAMITISRCMIVLTRQDFSLTIGCRDYSSLSIMISGERTARSSRGRAAVGEWTDATIVLQIAPDTVEQVATAFTLVDQRLT